MHGVWEPGGPGVRDAGLLSTAAVPCGRTTIASPAAVLALVAAVCRPATTPNLTHLNPNKAPLVSVAVQMVTIVDPHIKRDSEWRLFKEAEEKGLYVKNKDGNDFDGCAGGRPAAPASAPAPVPGGPSPASPRFACSPCGAMAPGRLLPGGELRPAGTPPGRQLLCAFVPSWLCSLPHATPTPQLVLAWLILLPGHAEPRCAGLVGAAVLHQGKPWGQDFHPRGTGFQPIPRKRRSRPDARQCLRQGRWALRGHAACARRRQEGPFFCRWRAWLPGLPSRLPTAASCPAAAACRCMRAVPRTCTFGMT